MTARDLGVRQRPYKMLKLQMPALRKKILRSFFKNNVEKKRKPRGENSFVAPHAHVEYQVDLFFINKNDLIRQQFRIGLV